jgi:hypothetical protein
MLRRFATRCNIPRDDILHSHCRDSLKSYINLTRLSMQTFHKFYCQIKLVYGCLRVFRADDKELGAEKSDCL